MFIEIIKGAFSRWWDKLGYTFLTSFLGAINPFYLYLIATILIFFTRNEEILLMNSPEQFFLYLPAIILMIPVFPTSFAAISVQKKLIENEIMYFKQYFPEYGRSLGQTIKPSLLLSLMYGAGGFLLAYAGIFYWKLLSHPAMKIAAVVLLSWIFIFLFLSQFVLLPLIIYNPELKLKESIKISFKMVVAQGLTILAVVVVNLLIHMFLTLSRALGIFAYFGFTAHLRIYTHKEIVRKYAPPAPEEETEDERYANIDATRNWAAVLKRFEEEDKKD